MNIKGEIQRYMFRRKPKVPHKYRWIRGEHADDRDMQAAQAKRERKAIRLIALRKTHCSHSQPFLDNNTGITICGICFKRLSEIP